MLKNHIAELEDEKGNLQLRLVDLEETLAVQGEGHNAKFPQPCSRARGLGSSG